MLTDHAAETPVLLVLEDLHWADTSTLDLVVFLAHNLADRRVLLLATYRADEPSSAERMRRLADGVRRSGSALLLDLGPLAPEELSALLAAHTQAPTPAALSDAIIDRSDGNPFFAEELLAAADGQSDELPRGLRDLLLQRVARLDRPTQSLLRLAAAAGRDVGYPLLLALAALPESGRPGVAAPGGRARRPRRRAVDRQLPIPPRAPGGGDLLDDPARRARGAARAAGGRARAQRSRVGGGARAPLGGGGSRTDALVASVEAAREAEDVFGLAEALAHLERALDALARGAGRRRAHRVDLAELCSRTAELASQIGAAPRAVELGRRAIELVGKGDALRAARLYVRLGRVPRTQTGSEDAASPRSNAWSSSCRRAALSRARVGAGGRSRAGWGWPGASRVVPICEQALALARSRRTTQVELRVLRCSAPTSPTSAAPTRASPYLRRALELAEESGDHSALERASHSPTC